MSNSNYIQNIEKLINNYYNNYLLQNGGNNKLEKNIVRLYNCYVLSQNQNQDKLSLQIKTRLDNKITELANELIGGEIEKGKRGIIYGYYPPTKLNTESESESESESELKSNTESELKLNTESELKLNTESDTVSELDKVKNTESESDRIGNYIKTQLKNIIINYIDKLKLNTIEIAKKSAWYLATTAASAATSAATNLVKKKIYPNQDKNSA
jgi:hypothetical protein